MLRTGPHKRTRFIRSAGRGVPLAKQNGSLSILPRTVEHADGVIRLSLYQSTLSLSMQEHLSNLSVNHALRCSRSNPPTTRQAMLYSEISKSLITARISHLTAVHQKLHICVFRDRSAASRLQNTARGLTPRSQIWTPAYLQSHRIPAQARPFHLNTRFSLAVPQL